MKKYVLMTVCVAALGLASGVQAQQVCPPGGDCRGPAPQVRPQSGGQPQGETRMDRQNPGLRQMEERNRHRSGQGARQAPANRGPGAGGPQTAGNPGSGHQPVPKPHEGPQHGGPQMRGPDMGGQPNPPPGLRVGGSGYRGAPFQRAGNSRFPPPPPGQEYRVMPNGWLVLVDSDTLGIVSIIGLLSALTLR